MRAIAEAPPPDEQDAVVDAVLWASRAMVGVAARSLADHSADVTLPQYRALVEIAMRAPIGTSDLAVGLGVHPSTVTRMCDRLARKSLLHRVRGDTSRRSVRLELSRAGQTLVHEVTRRRRAAIAEIVRRLPAEQRHATVTALRAFAEAAGQAPQSDWTLGWGLDAADGPRFDEVGRSDG